MLDGKEARGLGRAAKYGLTTIINETPIGPAYGHSGFFPGYLTEVRHYPQHKFAIAFQVNNSNQRAVGKSTGAIVQELSEIIASFR